MKRLSHLGIASLLCALSFSGLAEESMSPTTRSVGKLVSDNGIELKQALKSQALVTNVERSAITASRSNALVANRYDQFFSIYSASVELLSDLDGDGFHHAINVTFDVDVDYDGATVYAKLYLSREGGPWIQYHTTDLYEIFEDREDDEYEVMTELVEGYPSGYYALMIEIYSLNHSEIVASEVLDYHNLGEDLMLENLSRDEVFVEEVEVTTTTTTTHGGGSFSLFIWLLLVQVVIAARGALTLSPRKTIIKRKGTSGLRSILASTAC